MAQSYFIDTMGCQMNERDSETVAGILEQLGYQPARTPAEADFIALNTCAVRAKPEHKVFSKLGELRQLKQRHPQTIIAVLGCVAQVAAEQIARRAPYVDIIIGPRNYSRLAEAIAAASQASGRRRPIIVTDTSETTPDGLPVVRSTPVSAFINVTYGCNNFCAYCIVPYARGREQSRPVEQIVAEVEDAVTTGHREITLLGQNVNSYGTASRQECRSYQRVVSSDHPSTSSGQGGCPSHSTTREEEYDFADLLGEVSKVAGLERIRFTTSHPKDLSLKLLEAMAELPAVCEHLHLPIQSGDDEVLARMGRGYTSERYRGIVAAARARIPQISITTDVMVGFPGETEEQFENTLRAFEEIRFDQAFMFKYSDRPGTRAAEMPDKVPEPVKQARLERLVAQQNEIGRQINEQLVGQSFEVLVEGPDPKSAGKVRGRTRTNKIVIFPGTESLQGQLVPVQTEEAYLWGFLGRQVGAE